MDQGRARRRARRGRELPWHDRSGRPGQPGSRTVGAGASCGVCGLRPEAGAGKNVGRTGSGAVVSERGGRCRSRADAAGAGPEHRAAKGPHHGAAGRATDGKGRGFACPPAAPRLRLATWPGGFGNDALGLRDLPGHELYGRRRAAWALRAPSFGCGGLKASRTGRQGGTDAGIGRSTVSPFSGGAQP